MTLNRFSNEYLLNEWEITPKPPTSTYECARVALCPPAFCPMGFTPFAFSVGRIQNQTVFHSILTVVKQGGVQLGVNSVVSS